MDPTGGVNPTAPVPADYMQSMGYAGASQAPPSFMQPTAPVPSVPQSVDMSAVSLQQTYGVASPTQDQFYPRPPSADNRPDWQQQIVAEVNAAQVYNPNPTQASVPQVEVLPSDTMQISQNPYQMVSYTPQQTQPQTLVQQYQTAAPVPVQNWQQPPSAYESTYQAPMGDIVIPLDETTSGGRNWLGVIIIVVTAVALISTVAFSVYYFGNKSGYKKGVNDTRKEQARKLANEATSSDQSSNEDDEASLDFSLVQPEYKDESIDGEIAEQIQSSDGLVVYVKGVDHDFQPTSSTHQGASGTELIKVNILVGNASQTQPLALKGDSFLIELPDGKTVSPVADIGTYEGQVGSLTLTSGNKARLAVVFEVEKGVKSIKLLRQQSYVLKASGQTVIMQMRIALD